jgi:PBP1b-binding outer membrane lipoprotein LpoB
MRNISILAAAAALLLAGCRGEPVPRDYQNHPPAGTHAASSSAETPSANGMRGASPEPSKGAEGKAIDPQPVTPQNAPSNDTTATTVTTATTATHT